MTRYLVLSLTALLLCGCAVAPAEYSDGYYSHHSYYQDRAYYPGYYSYGYGYRYRYSDHGQ
jgi:hypothetical protein